MKLSPTDPFFLFLFFPFLYFMLLQIFASFLADQFYYTNRVGAKTGVFSIYLLRAEKEGDSQYEEPAEFALMYCGEQRE